jgi:membrane protease YdiL (CAAX protease family)
MVSPELSMHFQIIAQKLKPFDPFISFFILIFFKYIGNDYLLLPLTYFIEVPSVFFAILRPLLFMAIAILYLMIRNGQLPLKSYLVKNAYELKVVAAGLIISWLIGFVQILFQGKDLAPFYLEFFDLPQPYYFFTFFTFCFLGPLFEETLFRGYMFEILRRQWSTIAAVIIVLSFSYVGHMPFSGIGEIVFLTLYQLVCTFVYIEGGLCASIIVHSFINMYIFISSV